MRIQNYLRRMHPSEIGHKNILISPLNWGMGHVSRCIPLIHQLLNNHNTIWIAGDSDQIGIFRQYFPEINFIRHEGYPFKFGKKGNFGSDLLFNYFRLKRRLRKEHKEVDCLVDQLKIDIVISDHRYGFRSEKCTSICLTHQVYLPLPSWASLIQKIHHNYLKLFDFLWIPDDLHKKYAGELSNHLINVKCEYIGLLSRFSLYNEKPLDRNNTVIIASGPKIYAENFLKSKLENYDATIEDLFIICAEGVDVPAFINQAQLFRSKDWPQCDQIILHSKKIISRSGYSTLMDIIELGCEYEISPTPGQHEQEYLFDLWNKNSFCKS